MRIPIRHPTPEAQKQNKAATACVATLFKWTSQGLNLGPPDYENDKMIFYDNQRF